MIDIDQYFYILQLDFQKRKWIDANSTLFSHRFLIIFFFSKKHISSYSSYLMSSEAPESTFLTSTESYASNIDSSSSWSLEAINKYNSINTFEEKIQYIKTLFSISDMYYNFDPGSTFKVDFHAGNASFCLDSQFSPEQSLFVCQSLERLLNDAIVSNTPDVNFDVLRKNLANQFRNFFQQPNTPEFNLQQIESILSFTITSFLQPIRLILLQFRPVQAFIEMYDFKKVFQPPPPIPLFEFQEQIDLNQSEFPRVFISSDINQIMKDFEKYIDEMESVANQRLAEIDAKIKMLSERLENP